MTHRALPSCVFHWRTQCDRSSVARPRMIPRTDLRASPPCVRKSPRFAEAAPRRASFSYAACSIVRHERRSRRPAANDAGTSTLQGAHDANGHCSRSRRRKPVVTECRSRRQRDRWRRDRCRAGTSKVVETTRIPGRNAHRTVIVRARVRDMPAGVIDDADERVVRRRLQFVAERLRLRESVELRSGDCVALARLYASQAPRKSSAPTRDRPFEQRRACRPQRQVR